MYAIVVVAATVFVLILLALDQVRLPNGLFTGCANVFLCLSQALCLYLDLNQSLNL